MGSKTCGPKRRSQYWHSWNGVHVREQFGEVGLGSLGKVLCLGLAKVVREDLVEVIVDVWLLVSVLFEPCLEITTEAGA